MKFLLISLSALLLQTAAYARVVQNLPHSETQVEISRVVNVVKLVEKPGLQANITVEDLGGSTDVSPTQVLYFTLYSKGEMFSTDATFKLGYIYEFKSAKRLSGGVYEVIYSGPDDETSMPKDKKMIIDAQEAIMDLKEVDCPDFDCEASRDFKATIKIKDSNM
jgi:hypothetical protein